MKVHVYPFLTRWLPFVALATMMAGLLYITAQQDLRLAANDPQIQLAEDVSSRLAAGEQATAIIRAGQIDIQKSISPFVAVFDESGKAIVSSGTLDGQTFTLPNGVFAAAKNKGENRLTWQPREGVRMAVVVAHYSGASESGFVVAGRSLRETEARIFLLGLQVLGAWIVMIIVMAVVLLLLPEKSKSHSIGQIVGLS